MNTCLSVCKTLVLYYYTYSPVWWQHTIDSDPVLCLFSLSMQGLTFPQILNLGMDNILLFIPMSIAMATKRALKIATKACTQISIAHGPV